MTMDDTPISSIEDIIEDAKQGRPAIGPLAVDRLDQAPRFARVSAEAMGEDLWERYERL